MNTAESTAFFRRAWSVYDHIVEHNYMYHREIHAGIAELLKRRADLNRYAILDLGCGNARFIAQCLHQAPPARYEGVDLSESALEEARAYLAGLSCPVSLRCDDLLEAAETTDRRWDVVYTGYALHHLSSEEKARFFQALGRSLNEGGWLFLVDMVREENQTREQYLDNYVRLMRTQWTRMPPDQVELACEHVATHDYPEKLAGLSAMAAAAGLGTTRVLAQYGPHYSLLITREDLA